jgi:hypothetical protein
VLSAWTHTHTHTHARHNHTRAVVAHKTRQCQSTHACRGICDTGKMQAARASAAGTMQADASNTMFGPVIQHVTTAKEHSHCGTGQNLCEEGGSPTMLLGLHRQHQELPSVVSKAATAAPFAAQTTVTSNHNTSMEETRCRKHQHSAPHNVVIVGSWPAL